MIKTRNYVAKDTSIFCAVLLVSDSDVNNENESDLSTPHPPLRSLSSPVFKYRNIINCAHNLICEVHLRHILRL